MNGLPYPPTWYSASQAMMCCLGAILIFSLWQRSESSRHAQRDPGLFYLGISMSVSALIGLGLFLHVCPPEWSLNRCMPAVMASTMGNAFLLLGMAYFEYGPIEFKIAQDNWKWHFAVLSAAIFVALLIFFLHSTWPDFILSFTTLSILGLSAYRTFKSRGYTWTSKFSVMVIMLALLTRYWESVDARSLSFGIDGEWSWILLLAAKMSLMLLFLTLGFNELSGKVEPPATDELRLEFAGKEDHKNSWTVILTIPNFCHEKPVELPPVLHRALLDFAVERLRQNSHDGWIKIKDKYYPADLSRICRKLGVATPLVFENDLNGGYRLRVPAENINIHQERFKMYADLMSLIKDAD